MTGLPTYMSVSVLERVQEREMKIFIFLLADPELEALKLFNCWNKNYRRLIHHNNSQRFGWALKRRTYSLLLLLTDAAEMLHTVTRGSLWSPVDVRIIKNQSRTVTLALLKLKKRRSALTWRRCTPTCAHDFVRLELHYPVGTDRETGDLKHRPTGPCGPYCWFHCVLLHMRMK